MYTCNILRNKFDRKRKYYNDSGNICINYRKDHKVRLLFLIKINKMNRSAERKKFFFFYFDLHSTFHSESNTFNITR